VQQNEYRVELSWTNPPRYIDGSTATDLATVHVFRNGALVHSIPQPQQASANPIRYRFATKSASR